MNPHVFVAMPFGVKEGIDFNRVYREYIAAALREEGFEVFRADEEMRGGEIRADMFQELLLADLVVVDLSIDNPNVWYELGVRHALRSRGVILVQSKREYVPFDVYTDRKIRYSVRDGGPDPATLEADKNLLRRFARETLESWQGRKISPVYQLLPYLEEPEWKKLYVEGAGEYRDQYENWRKRVETARRDRKPANILVLAEEAPNHALLREARVAAGKALLKLGHFSFALEQLEKGLEKDPEDAEMLRLKAVALGRLGRNAEAKGVLEGLEKHSPGEAETPALLGRVVKDGLDLGMAEGEPFTRGDAGGGDGRGRSAPGGDGDLFSRFPSRSGTLLLRHQCGDAAPRPRSPDRRGWRSRVPLRDRRGSPLGDQERALPGDGGRKGLLGAGEPGRPGAPDGGDPRR